MLKRYSFSFMAVIFCCFVYPKRHKVSSVSSLKKFEKITSNNELVVALFYQKNGNPKGDALVRTFENVSKKTIFRNAGVRFIKVDVMKKKGKEIAKSYSISKVPIIILIEDGMPLYDNGYRLITPGHAYPSRERLIQFINENFGDAIKEIIKEERKEKRRKARERRYARPYFNYGYSSPWYYDSWWPYHSRPRFGFGLGFGRRGWW